MMEGWKDVKINQVAKIIGGFAFKSKDFSANGDIPVIKIKSIKNRNLIIEEDDLIDKSFLKLNKKFHINYNDILIALTGSHITLPSSAVGRVAKSRHKQVLLLNQRVGKFIADPIVCNHDFLYYLLITDYFFQSVGLRAKGAANQANISGGDIGNIKIKLPPLYTQNKIAKILSAYDDLIENNLKRIKLLEEKAQLTYEEWFVRMKFPGHESTPIDKETGLPEGWEIVDLKNYLTIKHGYAYKGEFFKEDETNRILLTPGNFKIGGGIKLSKVKYYDDEAVSPQDYVLNKHDLLLTMTDLSKMGDTLGFPLLVPSNQTKVFLHNQRLGKVLPIEPKIFPKYFFYMYFKDLRYRAFVVGSASGATVKHTAPKKILAFKPKLPLIESELIKKFDSIIKPLYDTIDILLQQIQHLKEARDILLPRLMTGMIDVDKIDLETPQPINA